MIAIVRRINQRKGEIAKPSLVVGELVSRWRLGHRARSSRPKPSMDIVIGTRRMNAAEVPNHRATAKYKRQSWCEKTAAATPAPG